jgi:heptosyltransferase III
MRLWAVNRILVIRLRMIGDVLLTTPAVRTLKRAFPRAHLTYITQAHVKDVLLNNPDIDELLLYDAGILRQVAEQPEYDVVINFDGGGKSEAICLASGAKYRVGSKGVKVGHLDPYNVYSDLVEPRDVIDNFLGLTRALGLEDATRETRLFLTSDEEDFAGSFWEDCGFTQGRRVVGLHPGGDHPKKLWAAKNYALLADKLIADSGYSILIFQGPGEEKIARSVCQAMQEQALLVPLLPIRKNAALVKKCHLFISSDGGPIHIAAAVGVNVLGVYRKEVSSDFWFPYRDRPGCLLLTGLRRITVQAVLTAVRQLLGGQSQ